MIDYTREEAILISAAILMDKTYNINGISPEVEFLLSQALKDRPFADEVYTEFASLKCIREERVKNSNTLLRKQLSDRYKDFEEH